MLINYKSLRNIDLMLLIYNKLSFKNISFYLNSKYDIKNLNVSKNIKKKSNNKRKIELYFCDFLNTSYQKMQIFSIKRTLSQKFQISINPENPEYLIYNVFGCLHLNEKYNQTIKIAYYSENQLPDFNIADYAVGQAHINYLDRYIKFPYVIGCIHYFNNSDYKFIRQLVLKRQKRKKFCAAVISNYRSFTKFRKYFINELNKYKKIDMGGKYNNNVGKIKNKIEFLSSYKFSISMENSEGDGYLSEKIIQSFLSGTIPIYYGDYMVDEYINPNSYILIRGENDIKKKIEYIKKIDNDDILYRKILKENILIDYSNFKEKIEKEKAKFLINIFDQEKEKARRVDNYHFK